MLSSLTGLLLTFGGDQPAVEFSPPLDSSIFSWDGEYLSIRENASQTCVCYGDCGVKPWPNSQFFRVNERVAIYSQSSAWNVYEPVCDDTDRFNLYDRECDDDYWGTTSAFSSSGVLEPGTYYIDEICGTKGRFLARFVPLSLIVGNSSESKLEELQQQILELTARLRAVEQSLESCQCASDLDGDGAVGFTDLVELISVWGPCSA